MKKIFATKPNTTHRAGFTLVEVIVVIAMIGILSGVVLVSMNNAKLKSKDAKIKTDVAKAAVFAEAYISGGGYITSNTSDPCKGSVKGFNAKQEFIAIKDTVAMQGGDLKSIAPELSAECTNRPYDYVVYSPLASNSAKFYCADSHGNEGIIGSAPNTTTVRCF